MGACELGLLSLALDLVTAWPGVRLPPHLRYPPILLMVSVVPISGFPWNTVPSRGWLQYRGVHCQGGRCSWGTSVPRCCPLPMSTGHQTPFLRSMLCPGVSQMTPVVLSPGKSRAAWDLVVSRSVTLLAFSPLDWPPPAPYYSPRNKPWAVLIWPGNQTTGS